jgi:predicted negative regulator of RcsB-dependent stress response
MASPSTTARNRAPQASLEAEDRIAMRAAELAAWARRNVQTIGIVTGIVLAVVIGTLVYRWNQQRKADEAAVQWLQVQSAAAEGPAGVARLTTFANNYAGTNEADEARLTLAGMYLDQNQAAKAAEEARRVAEGGGVMAFQGRMMLGAALAKQNQRDQAIAAYLQAASETDLLFQRQEARSEAALLYEEAGNWAKAAETYRAMLQETEKGTVDRTIMELRVAEAEARAGARR